MLDREVACQDTWGDGCCTDATPMHALTALELSSDKSSNHRFEEGDNAGAHSPGPSPGSSSPASAQTPPAPRSRSHFKEKPSLGGARQTILGPLNSEDEASVSGDDEPCSSDTWEDSNSVVSAGRDEPSSGLSWQEHALRGSPARARSAAAAARAAAKSKAQDAWRLIRSAHAVLDCADYSLKSRSSKKSQQACLSDSNALTGMHVSVYWPDDQTFYRGCIVNFDPVNGSHQIRYDDEAEEWLRLSDETFMWLSPRGKSAGCTPELQACMLALGVAGALDPVGSSDKPPAQACLAGNPRLDGAAVGWRLALHSPGCRRWCPGQVLTFNATTGRHHIGYEDGEDEWLELAREHLLWLQPPSLATPFRAGLPAGCPTPCDDAVGWRVAVYWPCDQAFYQGRVTSFDVTAGQHRLQYDDGELETADLRLRQVKWLAPPRTSPQALPRAAPLALPAPATLTSSGGGGGRPLQGSCAPQVRRCCSMPALNAGAALGEPALKRARLSATGRDTQAAAPPLLPHAVSFTQELQGTVVDAVSPCPHPDQQPEHLLLPTILMPGQLSTESSGDSLSLLDPERSPIVSGAAAAFLRPPCTLTQHAGGACMSGSLPTQSADSQDFLSASPSLLLPSSLKDLNSGLDECMAFEDLLLDMDRLDEPMQW